MSRRSARFSLAKPLSLPTSRVVLRCYAEHGKGFSAPRPEGVVVRILGINERRETRWAEGVFSERGGCDCPDLSVGGWKILGWMPADGSLPFGELDAVDPALAQINNLGRAHAAPFEGGIGASAPLTVRNTP